jgi:transposase
VANTDDVLDWLEDHPRWRLHFTPKHASWLNQIEIVFSIIQRKVIKPADFADLAELGDRLRRFEERYNLTARPFDWRFTSEDLAAMLERLDAGPSHIAAPLAA